MRAPIPQLKKAEIIKLWQYKCNHRMDGISHYNCYLREHPTTERVGYLDIECSNLNADFGFILCYCIKEAGTNTILEGHVTKEDAHNDLDKNLLKKLIKDILSFDRTIGFYSSKFDIPYIKTRCWMQRVQGFPGWKERYHKDLYPVAKRNIRASSRRLANIERLMFNKTLKTWIDNKHWIHAMQGQEKSMDYVLDHCRKDVIVTEKVHNEFQRFFAMTDTSI